MKFEWEEIDSAISEDCFYLTYRASVFGGWVLHSVIQQRSTENTFDFETQSESMAFIPDTNHEWKIE